MATLSAFPVVHIRAPFHRKVCKSGISNDAMCCHSISPLDSGRKLQSTRLVSPRAAKDELSTENTENESQNTQPEDAALRNSANPSLGRARAAKKSQLKPNVRSAVAAQSAFGKAAEYIRKRQLGAFDKDAPPLEDPVPPPEPPPGPLPEVEIIRGSMNKSKIENLGEKAGAVGLSARVSVEGGNTARVSVEDGNSARVSVKDGNSARVSVEDGNSARVSVEDGKVARVLVDELGSDRVLLGEGNSRSDERSQREPVTDKKKVLSALERAAKYKLERGGGGAGGLSGGKRKTEVVSPLGGADVPVPLDYKAQQEKATRELSAAALKLKAEAEAGAAKPVEPPLDEKYVEVEIVTREGVIKKRVRLQDQGSIMSAVRDSKRKGVSSIDFAGLNFSDRRQSSGPPPGLRESFEPPPSGELPEVEIITRRASQALPAEDAPGTEPSDLYKPKVSTWGVFPRPQNISRAFGGGKNIQPGQSLETEEEKAAREAKTRRLLDEYRRKAGLDMSPKVLAACNKAMKSGKALMDLGRLSEALPYFEDVMRQTVFNSELHGLAALQKAVCLDSMTRSDEARQLYEKLGNHPNGAVRKKAGQMLFGFQAARKLKLEGRYEFDTGIYARYFSAFSEGYNTMYKASPDEADNNSTLKQALPYIAFLLFPLILVAYIALSRAD